jgi:peptidoglycan-associated lipoprotein
MKKLTITFLILFVIGCSSAKKHDEFDSRAVEDYSSTEKGDDSSGTGADDSEGDIYGSSREGKIDEEGIGSEDVGSTAGAGYSDDEELSGADGYSGPGASSPFKSIYFEFDSYEIQSDSVDTLESIASWMKNNKNKKVVVEGHCDERGTNEYNLALGDKRASAVKDYLVISGTSADRITVLSYGEERPVCQNKNESCYQQNRRAYVVVSK